MVSKLNVVLAMACVLLPASLFGQCDPATGQCRTPVRNAAKAVFSGVTRVAQPRQSYNYSYGSTGTSAVQSYGSSGTGVRTYYYSSSQCNTCHQPAASSVRVEYVETSSVSSVSSSEVSALGIKKRKQSREVIMEAIAEAESKGSISNAEARAIRASIKTPRGLARVEDLVLEKAYASGAYSFTLDANGDIVKEAINWEAIGDFILKIAPIIFKLIEMFALDMKPADLSTFQVVVSPSPVPPFYLAVN